ncbi:NAR1 [Sanghuangporus vaninii]
MAFSSALTLTDLNDFITPSQACIKPVEQSNGPPAKDEGAASTQIHIDSSGSYYELSSDLASASASASAPAPRKLETAQISLNDCLACSGCITSAESVLITMQSHEEVLSVLANNPPSICLDHKTPVLSISPQSLASLAATISSSSKTTVTLKQVLHRVTAFAYSLGFQHVYDTTFARHIALLEHAREFHERKHGTSRGNDSAEKLPMLASACPGWVCYAEKTHPEMLPFISQTKSPQQVMGTLVKKWLAQKWGKKPDKIYHVTVMPCYDKKLEASREDFYDEAYATRDVDCVITTGELELMMRERGFDISQPLPSSETQNGPLVSVSDNASDDRSIGISRIPTLLSHPGTSSGSYLHYLLHLQQSSDPTAELTTRQVRGTDFEEYILRSRETGKVIFKGARCYGFRNLQNIVRRVGRAAGVQVGRGAAGRLANANALRAKTKMKVRAKKGKDENTDANGNLMTNGNVDEENRPYDYVEVMACPGGCVNGGGQLKPILSSNGTENEITISNAQATPPPPPQNDSADMRWGTRAWTRRVEEAYWHDLPTPPPSPSPHLKAQDSDHIKSNDGGRSTRTHPHPTETQRLEEANELARQVLSELCLPPKDEAEAVKSVRSWNDTMDEHAESLRRSLFRTSYREVANEVSGIQVQW